MFHLWHGRFTAGETERGGGALTSYLPGGGVWIGVPAMVLRGRKTGCGRRALLLCEVFKWQDRTAAAADMAGDEWW